MNKTDINYSELSTTMIKELLRYDNVICTNSFYQLTANVNVKYTEYLDNDNYKLTLADNSKVVVIVNKLHGDD